MEKETFDKLVQDKIASHDILFDRLYDKERSWKAISKKRNKGLWYKLVAAIVICALCYGILIDKSDQPLEIRTNMAVTKNISATTQEKYGQDPEVSSVYGLGRSVSQDRNIVPAPVKQTVVLHGTSKPDTTAAEFVPDKLRSEPAAVMLSDVGPDKEVLKITFKRGGVAEDTDIKVFLARGQKIKFDIFKKQTYDSTAYVLNEIRKPKQPIKLNF